MFLGHCYEMPAIINIRYLTRYMLQNVLNKFLVSYLLRNVSYYDKCQVPYLEMLGISYSRYTQNCQVLKCHIHDLLPSQCEILCRHIVLPPLQLQRSYRNKTNSNSTRILSLRHLSGCWRLFTENGNTPTVRNVEPGVSDTTTARGRGGGRKKRDITSIE